MTILASEIHVLVIPFPAQGHMIPLLDLVHKLAIHGGFTITILVTPRNLPFLSPLLSVRSSIEPLVFPFPPHPSIPSGVENNKDLPPHSTPFLIRTLGQLFDPLLQWFISHPSPPVAIISDMFLGWTQHLANQLSIPRIVFSPSGAMALSVVYSLWLDMPGRAESGVVFFPEIPNSPEFPWWQMSPIYRSYVENDPDWEFIKDSFRANSVSWGLVVNSCSEFEGVYLEHLKKGSGHHNVWAIGPLLPPHLNSRSKQSERGGPSSVSLQDLMAFLDSCQDHAVVYICFGSQTSLTNDQMEALGSSLERSKVNFIWCVEEQSNESCRKSGSGFEDRVDGRGLVIRGWAPQVLILRHRAVGAFLTHCGWNSVLEGLVAGVPMLAWPMGADQFVNASLLDCELKVALRVCEGAKTVPNSTELAQILAKSVSENRAERERVKRLGRVALDAIQDSGSSTKDFEGLVKNLMRTKPEANVDML